MGRVEGGKLMANIECDMLDRKEGKVKKKCDSGCKYFMFQHLETACVLSEVYSVKQGEECYIYEPKGQI